MAEKETLASAGKSHIAYMHTRNAAGRVSAGGLLTSHIIPRKLPYSS